MSAVVSLGFSAAGWAGHYVAEKSCLFEDDKGYENPSISKRIIRVITNIFSGVGAGEMLAIALSTTRFAINHFPIIHGIYAAAVAIPVITVLNKRYQTELHLNKLLNIISLVGSVGAVGFGALSLVGWGGVAVTANAAFLLYDHFTTPDFV